MPVSREPTGKDRDPRSGTIIPSSDTLNFDGREIQLLSEHLMDRSWHEYRWLSEVFNPIWTANTEMNGGLDEER